MTNLTPQQTSFIEALQSSTASIVLDAKAGSGKTFTLVRGFNSLPSSTRGLACAFNKSIAMELDRRMPENILCKTMNGLGHAAWGRHLGSRVGRLTLNAEKYWEVFRAEVQKEDQERIPDLKRWIDLARSVGIVPKGAFGGPRRDDELLWQELADNHGLDLGDNDFAWSLSVARHVLTKMVDWGWKGVIDFADQLYLPVVNHSNFQRFPIVMVDEAQDLNVMQHEMLSLLLSQGGRVIAAGDPHQAIYGFRGADALSMSNLSARFSAETMPLSVSFRCPQRVVKEAQRYVPDIEWAPEAPEGRVFGSSGRPLSTIALTPGTTILCRYNKPLVSLAFHLIKRRISARILGRDLGLGLIKWVRKNDKGDLSKTMEALFRDSQKHQREAIARMKTALAEQWAEKFEIVQIFRENLGEGARVETLLQTIENLFSDQGGQVTLSTIHKAKGLEWPRVIFLDAHRIPGKWATKDWEIQQERNMAYVAITRAQEELSYAHSEETKWEWKPQA